MTNVILAPLIADTDALYVWSDFAAPAWGNWQAFGASSPTRNLFTAEDWQAAIDAAVAHADRHGIPTVYVARRA